VIGDVVRVSPFAPSHFKTADYSTTTPNKPRTTPGPRINQSTTRVLTT
jgi:uroporphyrin-III C-methyltransferase/precorrin-2 dehydrogenase/sirohydrochlorin ferrochelatase